MTIPPWCAPPSPVACPDRRVIVVGAGVAGASTAHALTRRGWSVTVIDGGPRPASGASGNRSAVVRPMLGRELDPATRFSLRAFEYFLSYAPARDGGFAAIGADLHTDHADALAARLRSDAPAVRSHPRGDTLHLPDAGRIDPRALCARQLDGIDFRPSTVVRELVSDDRGWSVIDDAGVALSAPVLVLATGHRATSTPELCGLDITPTRGQVTHLRAPGVEMPRVRCGSAGYVIPAGGGRFTVGATFSRTERAESPLADDHAANVRAFRALTAWDGELSVDGGRVGFRASTSDRCPVVGAVPRFAETARSLRLLQHARQTDEPPPFPYAPGLFVAAGFGSRGVAHAPYAGELLARLIDGDRSPELLAEVSPLHPARALARAIRRTCGAPRPR